jgi:alkanesulfonate monooxygenase SsuD/methylene tetrahydromethanopterin reductase-like flavin-dependent oxidoreductase (luciferase family)
MSSHGTNPPPRVGTFPPFTVLEQGPEATRTFLARAAEAGADYACCSDHVSFYGVGFDGLVQATALAMLHPALPVHIGVYLLPLRDPVLVARPGGWCSGSGWAARTGTRSRSAASTRPPAGRGWTNA